MATSIAPHNPGPLQSSKNIRHIPLSSVIERPQYGPQLAVARTEHRSILANLASTFLLRVASRVSFVLLSFYLGEHFSSAALVALVLEAFYISELVLAPIVGSLSDRLGRKPFLLAAPLIGAIAALCLLLSANLFPLSTLQQFDGRFLALLLLILLGRLFDGATTALNAPASLGYITDTTLGQERLRARVMTAFEIVTVAGLALAIPFGGKVSSWFGIWGFLLVIALHLVNAAIVICLLRERKQPAMQAMQHGSLLESLKLVRLPRIFTFLPAWLAVNMLVGAWMTLIVMMLTYPNPAADLRHPGQLLYGGFSKDVASLQVGAFGLLFLLGMGLWTLLLPRLRRSTIMFIGLLGLAFSIVALTVINSMGENITHLSSIAHIIIPAMLSLLGLGVLLLSGFTPAALTHMAAIAETMPGKRGALMGLYSVVLGIGQLLGASLGGLSVDLNGCYGLMAFSVLLGLLALGCVLTIRLHRHDLLQTIHRQ